MSKEFEEWFTGYYVKHGFISSRAEAEEAFTAGRALGRREMKGECEAAVQESTVCGLPKGPIGEMYTRHALKAIEAIPEGV